VVSIFDKAKFGNNNIKLLKIEELSDNIKVNYKNDIIDLSIHINIAVRNIISINILIVSFTDIKTYTLLIKSTIA
jgi:hypothetical protein